MSKALRHVGVVVSDLAKAAGLYREYLGCELVAEYPETGGRYVSDLVGLEGARIRAAILRTRDDGRIELIEYVSPSGQRPGPVRADRIGVSHYALTVENLQDLYGRRGGYAVRFLSPPLTSPDGAAKVAYVVIMDEHLVELVEVMDPRAARSGGAAGP